MSIRSATLFSLAAVAALAAAPAIAAPDFQKNDTYKNPAIKAGGSLDLTNLVGHVSVVAASDGVLAVDSKIVAAAGSDADAQALAGKLKIETKVDGNAVVMMAKYPLDDYTTYYYHDRSFDGFGMSTSTTTYDGERVKISSGTFGSGANLHVDFVVHVPKGVHVTVDNKVGLIESDGVNAPQTFKSSSGDIKSQHGSDSFAADTGSGDVTLDGQAGSVDLETGSGDVILSHQKGGDVKVDTGSGDVKMQDLAGPVHAETGSGDVELRGATGSGAELHTGSGDIVLDDVTGSLKLEAGSGDIRGTNLKAGQVVDTDTGSGDVTLSGDLGAVVRLTAQSGSGSIVIHTTKVPSVHITAESDSGDVDVDLPNMQNVSVRHHSFRADVNGAKGSVELQAGSGDVTFTKD